MGKLNMFQIVLGDNPMAVYSAGNVVQGEVIVELIEPMKMRGRSLWSYMQPFSTAATIVDMRVTYIRKLAVLANRQPVVTANYSPVICSYLW